MVAFFSGRRVFVIVFRLEAGNSDLFDRFLDQFLNVDEILNLVRGHQRYGCSLMPGAARPADPVDIVFRCVRQLVVDDVR